MARADADIPAAHGLRHASPRDRGKRVEGMHSDRGVGANDPAIATAGPQEPEQHVWDGSALLAILSAGAACLTIHREEVDGLNVFPVPDGDTGSNMCLTLQSALAAGREALPGNRAAGDLAAAVAHGALLGARGNSGVILSQILRGLATPLKGLTTIDGSDLRRGLGSAYEMAVKAVLRPVEGTILTVIRGAAEHAARSPTTSPVTCLTAALAGAEAALVETPSLLPILRQAGVVDAGGQGLVYLLAGMARAARVEPLGADDQASITATNSAEEQPGAAMAFLDRLDESHGDGEVGYCTNFLVHLAPTYPTDQDRWRAELAAMGTSAVIVADERLLKVHIHTSHPHEPLAYGLALGEVDQVKIENMALQTAALRAQRCTSADKDSRSLPTADPPTDIGAISRTSAVVAVASGVGLAAALRGMGASAVVSGGPTMNPSVQDLLAAVVAVAADDVVLLPNNPNVVLTANHVPPLTSKRVAVVPSRSVPQGLVALSRFSPDDRLAPNLSRMTEALTAVRTVEITTAVRDASIADLQIAFGAFIGLVDDGLVSTGLDPIEVCLDALARADLAAAELVTIFLGADAPPDEAEEIATALRQIHPHLAVELHAGDQPHYRYVIGVE